MFQHAIAVILVMGVAGCATQPPAPPTSPPVTEPVVVAEPALAPKGRAVLTVPFDEADLATEAFGTLSSGEHVVDFFSARGDVMSNYAAVRVDNGEMQWLDLHTDEERAAGASPASGWGWVHVTVAPDDTIVGVLDWFVESSGPTLHIVTSSDGGASWVLHSEVEKPHYMALFERLELTPDAWRLTVMLDDCGGCNVPLGETTWVNAGAGWEIVAP